MHLYKINRHTSKWASPLKSDKPGHYLSVHLKRTMELLVVQPLVAGWQLLQQLLLLLLVDQAWRWAARRGGPLKSGWPAEWQNSKEKCTFTPQSESEVNNRNKLPVHCRAWTVRGRGSAHREHTNSTPITNWFTFEDFSGPVCKQLSCSNILTYTLYSDLGSTVLQ